MMSIPVLRKLFTTWSRRARVRPALVIVLAALVGSAFTDTGAAEQERPNLVLFLSTDHQAGFTGFGGVAGFETPHLDALAEDGTVFERAYSTSPIPNSGRASVLTGLFSYRSGVMMGSPSQMVPSWEETLMGQLEAAGYRVGFAGRWALNLPMESELSERLGDSSRWILLSQAGSYATADVPELKDYAEEFPHLSRALGAWGRDFIGAGEGPFCLILSFHAPHVPRHRSDPLFADSFADTPFAFPPNYGLGEKDGLAALPVQQLLTRQPHTAPGAWGPERFQEHMRQMARLVAGIDAAVGMVDEALEKKGVAGETVTAFTATNGHFNGNHGLDDKMHAFEESARVPLVIRNPRIPKPQPNSRKLAAIVDVMPTFLDAAGLDVPGDLDGRSLLPQVARDTAAGHARLPIECVGYSEFGIDGGRHLAVVGDRYKYVFWPYADERVEPAEQLFDLESDPHELTNLADDPGHAFALAVMRARYDAVIADWQERGADIPAFRRYANLLDRSVAAAEKTFYRAPPMTLEGARKERWEQYRAAYAARTGGQLPEFAPREAGSATGRPAAVTTRVEPDAALKDLLATLPNPRAHHDYWAVESAEERARLPNYVTIHGTPAEELTPASGPFDSSQHRTWERSHGNAASIRYSAHDQINRENVAQLEVVTDFRAFEGLPKEEAQPRQSTQGNPIFVGDLAITHTVNSDLLALEPGSGKLAWRFTPSRNGFPKAGKTGWRGFTHWPGNETHPPAILFGCGSGVGAVDPATGKLIEGFGEKGYQRLSADVRVAGAIFEETFVVPAMDGTITGLHVGTGEIQWVFHLSPGPGEYGYETWDKIDHQPGTRVKTGVSCWGGMALDEERGLAYFSTSSPKPNYVGAQHRGRNALSCSVVCLDVRTGELVWDFQELRHDIWDMEPSAPPMLVSFDYQGKRVDAVAQVTKMGNTLLLDRVTGRPVHDFRLRRAPTSEVPGEITWPYQPFLETPEPFYDQEFTEEDITDLTPEATAFVKAQIDSGLVKLGWMEPPGINYNSITQLYGGVNWPGGCFDPETGLLYIGVNHTPTMARVALLSFDEPTEEEWGKELTYYRTHCIACHGPDYLGVGVAPGLVGLTDSYSPEEMKKLLMEGRGGMPPLGAILGDEITDDLVRFVREGLAISDDPAERERRPRYKTFGYRQLLDDRGYPASKPPWGTLTAIHLASGKIHFEVPLGEYAELTAEGVPKTGTKNFGGPIVTAGGLVFVAGTQDKMIRAFDKETGEELWAHELPYAGFVAPSTAMVDGRQVVIINATATSHGFVSRHPGLERGDAVVAFALPEDLISSTAPTKKR